MRCADRATDPQIGVIILAAGESRRMGSAKQLLDLGGTPMVRRATEVALGAACGPVFVVIGAHADPVRAALEGLPVDLVENPEWEKGMGTSVAAGVAASLAADIRTAIITLADQPFVTAEVLTGLVKTHHFLGSPIVASRYGDTLGAPALFTNEYFSDLLQLEADQGCKPIILRHRHRATVLDCPEAAMDLDTPGDYAAWTKVHSHNANASSW